MSWRDPHHHNPALMLFFEHWGLMMEFRRQLAALPTIEHPLGLE